MIDDLSNENLSRDKKYKVCKGKSFLWTKGISYFMDLHFQEMEQRSRNEIENMFLLIEA